MSKTARQRIDVIPLLERGYVHVYTGDGKGKTTAALGLALRAVGSGLRVAIVAFMKSGEGGEFETLGQLNGLVHVAHFGTGCFIHSKPDSKELSIAQHGCKAIAQLMESRRFDLMILDEANMAVSCGLLTVDALQELIHSKPDQLELVITGRYAHPRIIEAADLVTEMVEIKHYYQHGVLARPGIDM